MSVDVCLGPTGPAPVSCDRGLEQQFRLSGEAEECHCIVRYVVAFDMWSGALEDMTLCLIWPVVVHIFFSHNYISDVHSLAYLIFLFPFKLFSSASPSTTL